ncbi:uncharacterized protein LOC112904640 [Agrilus planipennis]|nr:uncharacterized protein LOC112904640 [Agrilus planipennis]
MDVVVDFFLYLFGDRGNNSVTATPRHHPQDNNNQQKGQETKTILQRIGELFWRQKPDEIENVEVKEDHRLNDSDNALIQSDHQEEAFASNLNQPSHLHVSFQTSSIENTLSRESGSECNSNKYSEGPELLLGRELFSEKMIPQHPLLKKRKSSKRFVIGDEGEDEATCSIPEIRETFDTSGEGNNGNFGNESRDDGTGWYRNRLKVKTSLT